MDAQGQVRAFVAGGGHFARFGLDFGSNKLCVDFERPNLTLDLGFLLIPHDSQIKLQLKINPKIGSRSECISKPESHLWRDTAPLLDDIVDAGAGTCRADASLFAFR